MTTASTTTASPWQKVEYRSNKRGHTIMYRTREQAIRIQDRLNAKGPRA